MLFYAIALSLDSLKFCQRCSKIFGYLGQKYFIPRIPISGRGLLFCCSSLEFLVLTHSYSLITMGQLTDAHKAQILAYRNANLSMAEIGRKIGFSKTAIYKFLSSYTGGMSASGDFSVPMSFPRKCDPGTGTKNRIVTNRQLSIMRIQINKNPSMTAWQLHNKCVSLQNLSIRTIQRCLKETLGFNVCVAASKPPLNDNMRTSRLDFCKEYGSMSQSHWCNVMFSDESMFRVQAPSNVGRTVRRMEGSDRLAPQFVRPKVRQRPGVMVWGCFSAKGPGNLYFMPEDVHMNHEVYKTVLQDYMIPAYKRLKCTRFLQDRAPCHRSQHTTAFLKSLGIRVMNWPGNSPDLNSIENVWSKMKYDLREMDCSTKKKLIENIKKVWNNLPREYWVTLADSMPRRIQAVIDNQGGPTKY